MENRRCFLKILGAAALGGVAGCGDDTGASEASGPIAAGDVADYPKGTLKALPDQPVAVGHDDGGLYALTTICTHQQCDMRKQGSVNGNGLSCSCHGSDFTANGAVVTGPASTPLRHYRITLDGTAITVQADEVVDAATRVSVA